MPGLFHVYSSIAVGLYIPKKERIFWETARMRAIQENNKGLADTHVLRRQPRVFRGGSYIALSYMRI